MDAVAPMAGSTALADATAARLRHLAIRDFRNLARVDLDLPASGVALVGDNGHGKTNLLEAVYYLHHFRSLRGARDAELVRFGEAGFHVSAALSGAACDQVAAGFEASTGRRRVTLDGVPCDRLSDALGALPAVAFSPADVAVVAGAPAERRHYLDLLLASGSRRYLGALRDYRTALAQRNAGLRVRAGRAQAMAWEAPLAEHGATIRVERAGFVAWAAPRFSSVGESLGERQPIDLRYRSGLAVEWGSDPHSVRAQLAEALAAARDRDLDRGMTHAGPHRDDLDLRLGSGSLRKYGSAGQQRSAAIALRLLECAWSRERGRDPVLLLDDPVAELDPGRAERVMSLLTETPSGQVLLAVPRADDVPSRFASLERVTVRDGVIAATGGADA